MGVAIKIFTYLGDDEETPIVRFYDVEKAFYKAFKGDINIIKENLPGDIMKEYSRGEDANYQIILKIFSMQNDGLHILGVCGHLCEIWMIFLVMVQSMLFVTGMIIGQ